MDIVKKRSRAVLGATVLMIADIILIPPLIMCMVIFFMNDHDIRYFPYLLIPFLILVLVSVWGFTALIKRGYGKKELDPYVFHTGLAHAQLDSEAAAIREMTPVDDYALLRVRRPGHPDGIFVVLDQEGFSFDPDKRAEVCTDAAIAQGLLPEKAEGFFDASLAFLFLVQQVQTPEIQKALRKNASKRLFHTYAFLDQFGDLHVPAFFGSGSAWERTYRRNLNDMLRFLAEVKEEAGEA